VKVAGNGYERALCHQFAIKGPGNVEKVHRIVQAAKNLRDDTAGQFSSLAVAERLQWSADGCASVTDVPVTAPSFHRSPLQITDVQTLCKAAVIPECGHGCRYRRSRRIRIGYFDAKRSATALGNLDKRQNANDVARALAEPAHLQQR